MASRTEYARLDLIDKDTLDVLLNNTTDIGSLAEKADELLALATVKEDLLSLAEKATELLALVEGEANDNT